MQIILKTNCIINQAIESYCKQDYREAIEYYNNSVKFVLSAKINDEVQLSSSKENIKALIYFCINRLNAMIQNPHHTSELLSNSTNIFPTL